MPGPLIPLAVHAARQGKWYAAAVYRDGLSNEAGLCGVVVSGAGCVDVEGGCTLLQCTWKMALDGDFVYTAARKAPFCQYLTSSVQRNCVVEVFCCTLLQCAWKMALDGDFVYTAVQKATFCQYLTSSVQRNCVVEVFCCTLLQCTRTGTRRGQERDRRGLPRVPLAANYS